MNSPQFFGFEFGKFSIKQLLVATLLLTLISCIALGLAISRGVRSYDWMPVAAVVGGGVFEGSSRQPIRLRWRRVAVNYDFDGQSYRRTVAVFSTAQGCNKGTQLTVYVNPHRPTELCSERGFLACDYAIAMACTFGLLAMAIVLLCILLTPKEDYESEVNESLM